MKIDQAAVLAEWALVKNVNLHKYYDSKKEYQKWRRRFIDAGLLMPKRAQDREARLAKNRCYYEVWRKNNREKVNEYTKRYWKKKLSN